MRWIPLITIEVRNLDRSQFGYQPKQNHRSNRRWCCWNWHRPVEFHLSPCACSLAGRHYRNMLPSLFSDSYCACTTFYRFVEQIDSFRVGHLAGLIEWLKIGSHFLPKGVTSSRDSVLSRTTCLSSHLSHASRRCPPVWHRRLWSRNRA